MSIVPCGHFGLTKGAGFAFSGLSIAQLICMAPILRRLSAMHTSLNSACAFCRPRMLNWRNPKTLLTQPLGGSATNGLMTCYASDSDGTQVLGMDTRKEWR